MAENNNPIKYSDLVQPDSSITQLISQLDELGDAYMNTAKNIQSEAKRVRDSLVGVSGATGQQRDAIKEATKEAERLAKAERDLAFAESERAKELAMLKKAQNEANQLNKLQAKLNDSAVGSYNRLSAQYSINKIYLNNMTLEERESTEEGRKLVEETRQIYEEMKRLQEVTGKNTLNVGNYADATKNLRTIIRENTQELAQMAIRGEEGSAAYQKLLKETGDLQDQMDDTRQSIKNMASDTSALDSVLSGAAAAGGGFSVVTGAMELFGAESENVQQAQKTLQASIAITTGLTAIQNAVQKQSALMLGINKIQTLALAKAQAYQRLIQIKGTAATVGATIAQKIFNAVAMANPYVLLAIALITVVGALAAFAFSSDNAADKQQRLNDLQKNYIDSLELEASRLTETSDQRIRDLERELTVAQAKTNNTKEIQRIEDELFKTRMSRHNQLMGFYGKEISEIDKNRKEMQRFQDFLQKLNNLKAEGNKKIEWDVDLDGNIETYKIDDAINIAQQNIDNYGRMVEIGVNLVEGKKDLDAGRKAEEEKRRQEGIDRAKAIYKLEQDLLRKSEDAKIQLITDSFSRQRAEIGANYRRQIEDLQYQLKTEVNLTAKGRQAINDTIKSLREQQTKELLELGYAEAAALRELERQTQDAELSLMTESFAKQRALISTEYERKREDLVRALAEDTDLTVAQREQMNKQIILLDQQKAEALRKLAIDQNIDLLNQERSSLEARLDFMEESSQEAQQVRMAIIQKERAIELAENSKLAEDLRLSEAEINARYDNMVLQSIRDFAQLRAQTEFEIAEAQIGAMSISERKKTQLILAEQKKRLEAELALQTKPNGDLTDQGKIIAAQIEQINKDIKEASKPKDIYDLLGFDFGENADEKKQIISDAVNFAMEAINMVMEARIRAAEAAVEAADKEVAAAQKSVDSEIEARNQGYASNVVMAQKELDNAKKNQDKALKEQQKAQKQQAAIQTLQQIGNLVSATAMIWAQLGFPWAIPAIAVMWGTFALSKIKAAQMAKQQTESYGDGTVELLQGGSHQSGRDIDLGAKPDGTRRRAEGGEYFAIINKRNSKRFRGIIPDVIKSLNNGTFASKYMNAYDTGGVSIMVSGSDPDMGDMPENIRAIREQNERRIYNHNGKTVEIYKNVKRTYTNS